MKIVPKIDSEAALRKYAELKKIPLDRVLFHAAKDMAQAGIKATPLATVKDGTFYTYVDPKTQERKYIHSKDVNPTRTPTGRKRMRKFFKSVKEEWKLHPFNYSQGWSRASWIGIMRALGMSTSKPNAAKKGIPGKARADVERLGTVTQKSITGQEQIILNDRIHFDGLGHGSDRASQAIIAAGLKNATQRIAKDWAREIRKISK